MFSITLLMLGLVMMDAAAAQIASAATGNPIGTAVDQLAQMGILGIIVIVAGYAIMKMAAELRRVNEARIDEAKRREEQLLGVIKDATQSMQQIAASLEANREAMGEVRESLRDLAAETRTIGERVNGRRTG